MGEPMLRWDFLENALTPWPKFTGARATLINLSENHTFRLDMPDGSRAVLRVHRPGYHSKLGIESELAWMTALRRDAKLFTPKPLPSARGTLVQEAAFLSEHDIRHMVAFAFEDGEEPPIDDNLTTIFVQLGELAALCHAHVTQWKPPEGFFRQTWTAPAILDADGIWGDWRQAPGVSGDIGRQIALLDAALRERLAAYGMDRDRFGLVHADMRLANLLVADGITRLIDFDDCGYCWFGYDFGAAVSFFEDSPMIPALREAWLSGYGKHRPFGAEHRAMLDCMVLLRRMALLAWTGSHAETELAQSLHASYALGTAEMAERFLTNGSIDR